MAGLEKAQTLEAPEGVEPSQGVIGGEDFFERSLAILVTAFDDETLVSIAEKLGCKASELLKLNRSLKGVTLHSRLMPHTD